MTMKRVSNAKAYRWLNRSGWFEGPAGLVGPGEEFIATPAQVPTAFRDTIDCLGPAAATPSAPATPAPTPAAAAAVIEVPFEEADEAQPEAVAAAPAGTYEVLARGAGWYDVVNTATNEAYNTAALRLGPANALAEELNDG